MEMLEIIGHLGADAIIQRPTPQSEFISFRVGASRRVNGNEVTQWYDCIINNADSKLLPYLKKGQGCFVRGYPSYRIFDSAKFHQKMIGISIAVREFNFVGKRPDITNEQAGAPAHATAAADNQAEAFPPASEEEVQVF